MFDHKALPHWMLFQNCIRLKGGSNKEELQNGIHTQRHELFAVVKLMIKRNLMMVTYQKQNRHLESLSLFLTCTVPVLTLSRV